MIPTSLSLSFSLISLVFCALLKVSYDDAVCKKIIVQDRKYIASKNDLLLFLEIQHAYVLRELFDTV